MDENKNQNPVPTPPSDEEATPNTSLPQVDQPVKPVIPVAEPVKTEVSKENPVSDMPVAEPVSTEVPSVEKTESELSEITSSDKNIPVVEISATPDAEAIVPDKGEESIHEDDLSEGTIDPIEKTKKKSKKQDIEELTSGRKMGVWTLFRWFLIFGGILLAIFYMLLLWGLLGKDVSNPLFGALNIQEADLQSILLSITNYVFGFLAIFFLLGTLVKFFQWLMLGREAANRGEYGKKSVFFLGIFIFICIIWVGAFWVITNANVEHKQLNKSIILTVPEKVIGLNAPVIVEFDVGTELFKQIDPELIRQINWDFEGDGKFDANGPKVTHRFIGKGANNGRYPVSVSVDYFSPSAQSEKTYTAERLVMIANEAVQAVFSADKEQGPLPLTVQFNAEESRDPDGEIVLYEWDLDGNGSYEILGGDKITPTATYSKVGTVEVSLRVTGSNNDTSVEKKSIIVEQSAENIQAKITSENGFVGVPPFVVHLSAEESYTRLGNITSYQWQVAGEKDPVLGRKLTRTLRTPGEYKVSLIIENDVGERDKIDQIITVTPQLKGSELKIITKPSSTAGVLRGSSPFEVELHADTTEIHNPIEWRWDFEGDGIDDTFEESVHHVYKDSGEYNLTLTVLDAFQNKITTVQRVIVDRAGVQARIHTEPSFGTVPLTVEFDGSASTTDRGEIVMYSWEFPGKEPVYSGAKLSYEFNTVGTFPVKLVVRTSEQETGETETMISVRSQPLNASFEVFPNIENPLEIRFDATSSKGSIAEYQWDFGDGNVSRKFMPVHTYGFAGDFNVSLRVLDAKGIVSSFSEKITVGDRGIRTHKKGLDPIL